MSWNSLKTIAKARTELAKMRPSVVKASLAVEKWLDDGWTVRGMRTPRAELVPARPFPAACSLTLPGATTLR